MIALSQIFGFRTLPRPRRAKRPRAVSQCSETGCRLPRLLGFRECDWCERGASGGLSTGHATDLRAAPEVRGCMPVILGSPIFSDAARAGPGNSVSNDAPARFFQPPASHTLNCPPNWAKWTHRQIFTDRTVRVVVPAQRLDLHDKDGTIPASAARSSAECHDRNDAMELA